MPSGLRGDSLQSQTGDKAQTETAGRFQDSMVSNQEEVQMMKQAQEEREQEGGAEPQDNLDSPDRAVTICVTVGVGLGGFLAAFFDYGVGWLISIGCGIGGAILGWLLVTAWRAVVCHIIR